MPFKFPTVSSLLKNRSAKIILNIFVVAGVIIFSYLRPFDTFENIALDTRFRLRTTQPVNDKIVIIEISDDTLNQLGYWPLPRDFHASLVDVLSELGVKQVMFDLIFTDQTDYDNEFQQALRKADNAYLPYVLDISHKTQLKNLPEANKFITPLLPEFKKAARETGFINSYKDNDGKTRWTPLFIRKDNELHPQIALEMASDYLGIPIRDVVFKTNHVLINNKLKIPTARNGTMLVNYAGYWKDTFIHYSYVDILAAYQDQLIGQKPRVDLTLLKDAVCFIGLTATGTSDLHPIPLENNYPLVGLHANVFNSIVQGQHIHRADEIVNILILIVLLFLIFKTSMRLRKKPFIAFLIVVGYCVVFCIIGVFLFTLWGVWIDVSYPLRMMVLMFIGVSIYNIIAENKRREIIERELSIAQSIQESFLPKPIKKFHKLQIASRMKAAKHVGGDLYDLQKLDENKFGILIGDVSGKGVPAALVMARAMTIFRMLVKTTQEPGQLYHELNMEMAKDMKAGMFVTSTYIVYDATNCSIKIASAGHSATLVYRSQTGEIEQYIPKDGMPLGLLSDVEYSQEETVLNEGDKVILYTDGISEAMNLKREEFGEKRLYSAIKTNSNASPEAIVEAINAQINVFAGKAPQHDDCTLIILNQSDCQN